MKIPTNKQFQEIFPGDSRQVLEGADQFILLSLDPKRLVDSQGVDAFHEYRIVGQTLISDPNRRAELIASLYDGIAEGDDLARCFDPHHGIRAVQGKSTLDLVICFLCSQMRVYFTDSNTTVCRGSDIAGQPAATFDRIVREAGVPLGDR
jgi:hypothetical protein